MSDTGPSLSARGYVADEILIDGESIHVRAARPADGDLIVEHFGRLSRSSVRFRYFTPRRVLPPAEIERMTHVDHVRRVSLLAVVRRADGEELVGIGVYDGVKRSPWRAEVAFSVLDEHQGRGVGTILLEHLARIARRQGITEFEANVLGDNRKMLEVFSRSGFEVRRTIEEGVFHILFPTADSLDLFEAGFERRRIATQASAGRGLPSPEA